MNPTRLAFISKVTILSLLMMPLSGMAQSQNQTQTQAGQKPATIPQDIPQTTPKSSSTDDKSKDQAKPADQPIDTSKAKATGSGGKDDVDAIGNRKGVGGRGLGDWYSVESEIKQGKQYAQQIEQTVKLVQDPVVNEYVNRIGQNI